MRTRRTLVLFSALWWPREGGAERQLREVLEVLAADSWRVTVIAGGPANAAEEEFTASGVRVLRVRPRSPADDCAAGRELAAGALRAAWGLRPDVVIGSLVSAASAAGHLIGLRRGVPRVLRLGGHDLERLVPSRRGRLLGRFMVRGSNAIVINAEHLRDQIAPFSPRPGTELVLIRNGITTGADDQPASRAPGPTRVIFYTNGGAAKNEAAFTEVVRRCPDLEFRAVGRTAGLPAAANLELRGWRDPVAPELRWADIVVNTSVSEGSPNFCLQGLALGTLVTGFDIPGMAGLAADHPGLVGLVPFGDVARLAESLHHPLPPRRQAKSAIPTISAAAQSWDALLRQLIHRR